MPAARDAQSALHLLVPGDIEQLTGGYIYDRRICAGLAALGWDVQIHALAESFPEPPPAALAAAAAELAAIPNGAIVVIDGLALVGLTPLLPAQTERLNVVALIHHPLAYETGLDVDTAARLYAAERDALAHTEKIIVTSPWTQRALADFGVGPERISVVEPGTDPARPRVLRADGVPQLLCVASLTERKGHSVLFSALAQIADRPWELRCAGSVARDPALVARLRAQLARDGLGARVALLGELHPEELVPHYEQADVFVLASYMEGYGMAFAEALAHGLPIVATSGGAIAQTVPAAARRLVAPGDAAALAVALAELIDDPTARVRLASGAATARAALCTWPQASERFAQALLAARRR